MATLEDFYIKQGDTREEIVIQLQYGDGTLIARSLIGATVRVHMRSAAGTLIITSGAGTVIDDTTKEVGYTWVTGDTDTATRSAKGTAITRIVDPHQLEFQVTYSDGGVETFPNDSNINVHVTQQVA